MGYQNVPGRAPLKASDPRELSFIYFNIPKYQQKKMEIHRRAILEPILKKYNGFWVTAIGDIDVQYDQDLQYAILTNQSACDLDILIRVL